MTMKSVKLKIASATVQLTESFQKATDGCPKKFIHNCFINKQKN